MRQVVVPVCLVLPLLMGAASVGAQSACSTVAASPTSASALVGNTVCVGASPNWQHQEQLRGATGAVSGDLWDFKKGAGHRTDPSAKIGSWAVDGNNVTFNYGGASVYTFTVYVNNANVCLQQNGGGAVVNGTLKAGEVGC